MNNAIMLSDRQNVDGLDTTNHVECAKKFSQDKGFTTTYPYNAKRLVILCTYLVSKDEMEWYLMTQDWNRENNCFGYTIASHPYFGNLESVLQQMDDF